MIDRLKTARDGGGDINVNLNVNVQIATAAMEVLRMFLARATLPAGEFGDRNTTCSVPPESRGETPEARGNRPEPRRRAESTPVSADVRPDHPASAVFSSPGVCTDDPAIPSVSDVPGGDRIIHPVPSVGGSEGQPPTGPPRKSLPSEFPGSMLLKTVVSESLLKELTHTSHDHQQKLTKVPDCLSDFLKRHATVADLSDEKTLNQWLSSLKLSESTINGRRRYARIIQNYVFGKAGAMGISMRRQREEKTMPVAWNITEVEQIVQACLDFPKVISCDDQKVHVGQRTLLCLLLIYDTGIRISALMQRQRSDVRNGILIVPAADQKSKKEQRFPLSAETLSWIERVPNVRGRLIPHTYDQPRLDKPMRVFLTQILKSAGLPTSAKHKWHCLRRVHATQLAKAKNMEAAQRALGHSSIETTKRYVDTTQLDEIAASELIPHLSMSARPTADGLASVKT